MPRMVSRIVRWMSRSACVVTSPMTTQRPLVIAVSHATRAWASCMSMPSSTESETWSHTLSGCPSVTDSDVRRNEWDSLKEVVTTAANDNCGAIYDRPEARGALLAPNARYLSELATVGAKQRGIERRSGAIAITAILWRLAEQL